MQENVSSEVLSPGECMSVDVSPVNYTDSDSDCTCTCMLSDTVMENYMGAIGIILG